MQDEDARLQMMLEACQFGFSLELLARLTIGLDIQSLRICCDNVSTLPKYRKSKDTPNLSDISKAP